jgi:hypothetical protein
MYVETILYTDLAVRTISRNDPIRTCACVRIWGEHDFSDLVTSLYCEIIFKIA